MKTKLLKKIRKQYQIIHHPNGVFGLGNKHYNFNIFALYDTTDVFGFSRKDSCQLKENPNEEIQWEKPHKIFQTEQECINYLKDRIIKIMRHKYPSMSTKERNMKTKSNKKVWYNG